MNASTALLASALSLALALPSSAQEAPDPYARHRGDVKQAGSAQAPKPRAKLAMAPCSDPCLDLEWLTRREVIDPSGLGVGVEGAAAGVIGGKVYVSHGYTAGDSAYLRIYDIASNTWSLGPTAARARSEGSGTAVGTRLYSIGGRTPGQEDALEIFNATTSTWSSGLDMPTPRAGFGVAVIAGKIHVVGGRTADSPASFGTVFATHEVYDPGTNTWTTSASMPVAMGDCYATVAIGSKIYVFGGWDGMTDRDETQVYDSLSNTWTLATSMPTPRSNAIAGAISGHAVVVGGLLLGSSLTTTEVYDPTTDSWCSGPAKPTAGSEFSTAGPVAANALYVMGSGPYGLNLNTNEVLIGSEGSGGLELDCPDDLELECPADPAAVAAWRDSATASDDCAPVTVTSKLILHEPLCGATYRDTYEFTATSGADTERCTRTVTVVDTAAPVLSATPSDLTLECDQAIPDPPDVTASDACEGNVAVAFNEAKLPGGCADAYEIRRTWTATDGCGHSANRTQSIFVRDTTKPILANVPSDASVECNAVPLVPTDVTASDNCDPSPRVEVAEKRTDGSCLDIYRLERTWTATDRCGNSSSKTQSITVRDSQPPTLVNVPADATAECDAVPARPTDVAASDNCDPLPRVDFAEKRTDGSCPDRYLLERTWTATDRCGNSSSKTQAITVRDTTPPVLHDVPANATVECDAVPAPPTNVTATDNCDPLPRVDFAEKRTDGSCPDRYLLERTWTATDRCNNSSSKTQAITVRDTTPPVLHDVPADATVECDAVPAPEANVTATDNCDPRPRVDFAESRIDGRCPDDYVLKRTWTATDRCSNGTSQTQTITVHDTTPPALHDVPADASVECDAVPARGADVTATDNCDPKPRVDFAESRVDGRCPDDYVLKRTWTATDRCGNASGQTQTILVHDTTPPVAMALLAPLAPMPPSSASSPASPRSTTAPCSAPASGRFTVFCGGTDNCDPKPGLSARLVVTNHDVARPKGPCTLRVERVPVACGEIVELRLVAPPCPAKPPKQPRQPLSVTSDGVKVITGERIILEVTATDRCGNAASATYDPAKDPAPSCEDPQPDGTCCPALARPTDKSCKAPCPE